MKCAAEFALFLYMFGPVRGHSWRVIRTFFAGCHIIYLVSLCAHSMIDETELPNPWESPRITSWRDALFRQAIGGAVNAALGSKTRWAIAQAAGVEVFALSLKDVQIPEMPRRAIRSLGELELEPTSSEKWARLRGEGASAGGSRAASDIWEEPKSIDLQYAPSWTTSSLVSSQAIISNDSPGDGGSEAASEADSHAATWGVRGDMEPEPVRADASHKERPAICLFVCENGLWLRSFCCSPPCTPLAVQHATHDDPSYALAVLFR